MGVEPPPEEQTLPESSRRHLGGKQCTCPQTIYPEKRVIFSHVSAAVFGNPTGECQMICRDIRDPQRISSSEFGDPPTFHLKGAITGKEEERK